MTDDFVPPPLRKVILKIKRQRNFYDCGAACVSMLTGLTVPKARGRLGTIRGYGCFLTDIQRVLNQFEFKTKMNKSNQISHHCIVRVELGTQSHFILVWDNKIYDPAHGIRDSITENIKEVLEIS